MHDLIERQAAIDTLDKHLRTTDVPVSYPGIISALTEWLNELPPAQPELPEWAKKVEEYRKSAPSHIHNPLAWALYQTWKEYDR